LRHGGLLSYPRLVRSLVPLVLTVLLVGCPQEAPPLAPPAAVVAAPVDHPPTSPEVLVPPSSDFDIVNLLLDAHFVYWAHRGEKGILKVPLTGGPTITLVPGTDGAVTSLAADGTFLYFTTGRRIDTEASDMLLGRRSPRAGHFEGVVDRLKKDGAVKVEEIASGRFNPEDVAVDATNVYWVSVKKDALLVRQALGQVDAEAVVAHGNFLPGSLVVSGGFAYWIDTDAGPAVMRVSTNGGEPERVSASAAQPRIGHPVRLAADDAAVYISDAGPMEGKGAVVRVAIAGGAVSVLAENLDAPRSVGVRGGWVYWANKGTGAKNFKDGSLEKVSAAGGAKVTLATGLEAPDRLAVGDTRVAWNEVTGAIKDMAR
jgi:hypothetical protein